MPAITLLRLGRTKTPWFALFITLYYLHQSYSLKVYRRRLGLLHMGSTTLVLSQMEPPASALPISTKQTSWSIIIMDAFRMRRITWTKGPRQHTRDPQLALGEKILVRVVRRLFLSMVDMSLDRRHGVAEHVY
jgi:hypothetical protein